MIYSSLTLAKIFNRLKLLRFFRLGYRAKISTAQFQIPVIENNEGFNYHQVLTEPFLFELLRRLERVDTTYQLIDVGVNFGQTLLKWRSVTQAAPYTGFEASGLCNYYVTRLIRENKFANCDIIHSALGNQTGLIELYGHSEGDTRATIMKQQIGESDVRHVEKVCLNRLDDFLNLLLPKSQKAILKIDVEGAELMVLQGAARVLQELRPFVIFETLPHNNDPGKIEGQRELANALVMHKYKLFSIDEQQLIFNPIAELNNENDLSHTNYAAVPAESVHLMESIRV